MACESCDNTCKEDCTGVCGFYCDISFCDNACWATCASDCSLSCREGCKGGCSTACNSTCTGKTQSENIKKLIVGNKLDEELMNNINTAVNFELTRRGLSPSVQDITFQTKEKIDDGKINNIINNLKQTGQNISYNANYKTLALKSLAQNIIDTIVNANNEKIGIDSIK